MPMLEEVFKKSGVPTHTFIEPTEYNRVLVALRTAGKGMIVEGPSGIGKTSCIKKAIEQQGIAASCLFLSARKNEDLDLINALPKMKDLGTVIVDDFHRLPDETKYGLTDLIKSLADEEDVSSKVILIGINRAGQALIDFAPDLLHRVERIKFGRTNEESLRELIARGEKVLNCNIGVASSIAEEANGSFAMAQVLAHEACLKAGLLQTSDAPQPSHINVSLPVIREAVLDELSPRFFPVAREFCTGNRLRQEGRAPYLHLLRWLSLTPEGVLDTRNAMASNPGLKGSVSQVIEKGFLSKLIDESKDVGDIIHFDRATSLLTAEDPKLLYFIRHIIWQHFARQIGYFSIAIQTKYDFALSFAGEVRPVAKRVAEELTAREMQVFYDHDEQHYILAEDVEEYLTPIYRSESRYVVALMSKEYPRKVWTKFESQQFKQRFSEGAVIPVWFVDAPPGMFDEVRRVGSLEFDPAADHESQIAEIVNQLAKKLMEDREKANAKVKEEAAAEAQVEESKRVEADVKRASPAGVPRLFDA